MCLILETLFFENAYQPLHEETLKLKQLNSQKSFPRVREEDKNEQRLKKKEKRVGKRRRLEDKHEKRENRIERERK